MQVRFLRFLAVGGTAALVQFGSLRILPSAWGGLAVVTLAFAASTAAHYTMNRFWALPSHRRDSLRQFLEYLGVVAVSYGINWAIVVESPTGAFVHAHLPGGLGSPFDRLAGSADDPAKAARILATVIAAPVSAAVVFLLLNYHVFRMHAHPPEAGRGGD